MALWRGKQLAGLFQVGANVLDWEVTVSGIILDLADVSTLTIQDVSEGRRGRARVNLGYVPSEDIKEVEVFAHSLPFSVKIEAGA